MSTKTMQSPTTADEAAIRSIPFQMIDAWNKGDGEAFAAPFAEDADFIAFEGTHLKGRQEIAAFHQQLFDTAVSRSHLDGKIEFVRFLNPQLALMHAVDTTRLSGHRITFPSRDSMQIFVVAKHDGEWFVEGLLNARQLIIERQLLLDDLDALPIEDQRTIFDLVESFKQRHLTER